MTIGPSSDRDRLPEGEASTLIFALAAAPSFQVGKTGQAFAGYGGGIKQTEDGGLSWEVVPLGPLLKDPLPVFSLALSPAYDRDGLLFAGTKGGILWSSPHGREWRIALLPSPPPSVSALAVSPNFPNDGTLFAGTMEDGVFVSQNAGSQWVTWNFGLLDLNVLVLAISPDFSDDETLYAGTETGLFRSTNGGRAWREIELEFGYDAILSAAISPHFAEDRRLYIGSENHGLWVSTDGGEQWTRVGEQQISDPVNSILISGNDLLAATAGGLWRLAGGDSHCANGLPEELQSLEVSTVLAPNGISPGSSLLVGFTDGSIHSVAAR